MTKLIDRFSNKSDVVTSSVVQSCLTITTKTSSLWEWKCQQHRTSFWRHSCWVAFFT